MFHGRDFRAGLHVKAAAAELANREGNISMSHQSKGQWVKCLFWFVCLVFSTKPC